MHRRTKSAVPQALGNKGDNLTPSESHFLVTAAPIRRSLCEPWILTVFSHLYLTSSPRASVLHQWDGPDWRGMGQKIPRVQMEHPSCQAAEWDQKQQRTLRSTCSTGRWKPPLPNSISYRLISITQIVLCTFMHNKNGRLLIKIDEPWFQWSSHTKHQVHSVPQTITRNLTLFNGKMLATLPTNSVDHRIYGKLLGDSSSHTSHLWMCHNSRRTGLCLTEGRWGQMRDRAGHDHCEEKIWMTFESHWFGTWFIVFSKRELVPQSTQFHTMLYVFIFKLLVQPLTEFQWVILHMCCIILETNYFEKQYRIKWSLIILYS